MRKLVSPFGLVSRLTWLPVTEGEPVYSIYTGSLGDPGAAVPTQAGWAHSASSGNFDGAGGALDPDLAAHLAVAESLERYSSCVWDPDKLIWATAAELGEDAIPPWEWPNCSARELADPRCGLIVTDPRIPLRWVRGWSLTRGRAVFVPATQVYLKFTPESASERYQHAVSTGCAAHGNLVDAVTNGLLEVVERDSIALTWLQRLRLPRLEFDERELHGEYRDYFDRGRSENIRTLFFDATTDLGIPVVYGLQLADHDPDLAQLVAATCDVDPVKALAKLHREAASLRIALRSFVGVTDENAPADPQDTVSVIGGALLNGPLSSRDKFDFLLDGDRPVHRLADLPVPGQDEQPLPWLLDRMHRAGHEVIVVDLTTDEARQAGATVVRVLVPQAMPLSFAHRARYLNHPRLYTAPAAMGHPVHGEDEINPNPQPFA
ncbi:YcaO-like family protein [Amycolatopsis sp. NPDC059657]|uniref:YcaO-like family protein n=1 Tax=Amycolatopsis sp. NPDC059657 TaxID=3346899 RepID=UPI003671AF3C